MVILQKYSIESIPRVKKKKTQAFRSAMLLLALATAADVSARHVSFLETGRSAPSRAMVLRLAHVLDVPKHEGMTYFVINMRQPGVEVQPLKQMNGHASFNQVFFTDAEIEPEFMVGELGDGWKIARRIFKPMILE